MTDFSRSKFSRPNGDRALSAFTITVCSGKGGTGKSTVAALLARSLSEFDQQVAIVDCDFGVGDAATLANASIEIGSEDLFAGRATLEAAARQLSPNLWLIGTRPGARFDAAVATPTLAEALDQLESRFDVVIFDTAAAIDSLTLNLIGRCNRAIVVTTPRISAIADSYVQLKQVSESLRRPKAALIINQAMSEAEGEQALIKFIEMSEKFLGLGVDPLLWLPTDAQLAHLADNQGLYRPSAASIQSVKNLHSVAKAIHQKEITQPRRALSRRSFTPAAFDLKSVAAFDDREVTVHFSQE